MYSSDVSGRNEVYVRPYPGPGTAEQISLEGGSSPAWNPDGKEIFFVSPVNPSGFTSMMAAAFEAGPRPHLGRPGALFEADPAAVRLHCLNVRCYDVAPDGQRFYATKVHGTAPPPPVTQVNLAQNWLEDLKAKVPTR